MTPLAIAQSFYDAGDFGLAVAYLAHQIDKASQIDEEEIFLYSRALKAVSRYEEAENVLLLAGRTPKHRSRSLGEQAELAWLQHRYEDGRELAIASLEIDFFNKRVQTIRDRCDRAIREPVSSQRFFSNEKIFAHGAFYVAEGGNFGDLALPPTVRKAFANWRSVDRWMPFHVHQVFGSEQLKAVNESDGLIIGGGGLFLPDTSPNGNSGWQWNISDRVLRQIKVPLAVMAVGYNLFEGQRIRGAQFASSLNCLVDRADVIGLRNNGSISKVRALLPSRLADKITYMPCPTTILNLLGYQAQTNQSRQAASKVFINAAFDRSELRFRGEYRSFVHGIARYISNLRREGVVVEFAAHLPGDERLAKDLEQDFGIKLRIHGFYDMDLDEGYRLYQSADLVVGMRGHATMIPFGLGTPVLSLISHPKMRYFLEDIERLEWGVDIDAPHFDQILLDKTLDILAHKSEVQEDIASLQLSLSAAIENGISGLPS